MFRNRVEADSVAGVTGGDVMPSRGRARKNKREAALRNLMNREAEELTGNVIDPG